VAFGKLKKAIETPAVEAKQFGVLRVDQVLATLDPESNLFQVEATGTVGTVEDDEFVQASELEPVRVTFIAKPESAVVANLADVFTDVAAQLVKAQAKAASNAS